MGVFYGASLVCPDAPVLEFGSIFGLGTGDSVDAGGAIADDDGAPADDAVPAVDVIAGDPVEAADLVVPEKPFVFVTAFVAFPPRCAEVGVAGDANVCDAAVSSVDGGSLEEALAVADGSPKTPLKTARHFGRVHSKSYTILQAIKAPTASTAMAIFFAISRRCLIRCVSIRSA